VPNLLFRFASITALAGVGLACVGVAMVPAVQGLGDAGRSDDAMIDLGPLDQRSYVYASDGSLLTTLQAEIDRQPVPLANIPQHTIDAVLAVEDADFYAHDGVNLRATVRALVRNVDEGEAVQGGSTITQQVVKEELVGNAQTVDRKAREAVLARRLEELMTKDEILERYLNTVYLGNGAYGVQAGAETYFGKGVAQIDVGQSAFLAGMIANPSEFDPVRAPDASKARRDVALQRMAAEGVITEDVRAYIAGSPVPSAINQVNPETQDYFVEEVKQALFDDPRLGATREERQNRVFRGGLHIHTTLDRKAQTLATQSRNDVLAEIAPEGTPTGLVPIQPDVETGKPRNATGAVVSVEPGTGAVRAMVGGAGFESEKFNVTTQGIGRSGGSTFKVFVLMALLENGYLPNDSVSGSSPCTFRDIPGMFPDPYRVENFAGSGGGGGTITSQTLRSSNCAYVRLGQIVGIRKVVQEARQMGITTPLETAVSMPLGTKEVRPIEMAGAFASIAAEGVWNEPYYIDRVEGPDGKVLIQHENDPRRAASVQSARLAAEVLERNVQSGTGTRARIPNQHAAGKTGTAQDASDGWFVGFTPYLATAVWIGATTDNEPVEFFGTGITGGSYPAEIWGRYMRAWHVGLDEAEYGEPDPQTRSSRYLSMSWRNDSGGGSGRPRSSGSTSRRPSSSGRGGSGTTTTTEAPAPTTTTPPDTTPTTSDPGGGDGGGTDGGGGGTGGTGGVGGD
jgi:membrane peptidoglycan carboxypeptidase